MPFLSGFRRWLANHPGMPLSRVALGSNLREANQAIDRAQAKLQATQARLTPLFEGAGARGGMVAGSERPPVDSAQAGRTAFQVRARQTQPQASRAQPSRRRKSSSAAQVRPARARVSSLVSPIPAGTVSLVSAHQALSVLAREGRPPERPENWLQLIESNKSIAEWQAKRSPAHDAAGFGAVAQDLGRLAEDVRASNWAALAQHVQDLGGHLDAVAPGRPTPVAARAAPHPFVITEADVAGARPLRSTPAAAHETGSAEANPRFDHNPFSVGGDVWSGLLGPSTRAPSHQAVPSATTPPINHNPFLSPGEVWSGLSRGEVQTNSPPRASAASSLESCRELLHDTCSELSRTLMRGSSAHETLKAVETFVENGEAILTQLRNSPGLVNRDKLSQFAAIVADNSHAARALFAGITGESRENILEGFLVRGAQLKSLL